MEKKELKWYESPVMEVVELEMQGAICAYSSNADDVTTEEPGEAI